MRYISQLNYKLRSLTTTATAHKTQRTRTTATTTTTTIKNLVIGQFFNTFCSNWWIKIKKAPKFQKMICFFNVDDFKSP